MSELKPEKMKLSEINGGKEYQNGDVVQAKTINDVIKSAAYSQGLAENYPRIVEDGGEPRVEIEFLENLGKPRLVFYNLEGDAPDISQFYTRPKNPEQVTLGPLKDGAPTNNTDNGVVIGRGCSADSKSSSIGGASIGQNVVTEKGVGIGHNTKAGFYSVAIGMNSGTLNDFNHLIGAFLNSTNPPKGVEAYTGPFINVVLIGKLLKSTADNQIAIGTSIDIPSDSLLAFGVNKKVYLDVKDTGEVYALGTKLLNENYIKHTHNVYATFNDDNYYICVGFSVESTSATNLYKDRVKTFGTLPKDTNDPILGASASGYLYDKKNSKEYPIVAFSIYPNTFTLNVYNTTTHTLQNIDYTSITNIPLLSIIEKII